MAEAGGGGEGRPSPQSWWDVALEWEEMKPVTGRYGYSSSSHGIALFTIGHSGGEGGMTEVTNLVLRGRAGEESPPWQYLEEETGGSKPCTLARVNMIVVVLVSSNTV